MTTQTRKLINFFQKAFQDPGINPEKYLTRYRSHIQAAGQVFQFLALAKPDSKSVLGWKPTKRLMDLIVKSNAGLPKAPASEDVQVLLGLMLDTMLGSDPSEERYFCVQSLMRLGLVVVDSWGDRMPTRELLNQFTISYLTSDGGQPPPSILSAAQ
jgi:hypothetical protein